MLPPLVTVTPCLSSGGVQTADHSRMESRIFNLKLCCLCLKQHVDNGASTLATVASTRQSLYAACEKECEKLGVGERWTPRPTMTKL
jgi:hypothetical protein